MEKIAKWTEKAFYTATTYTALCLGLYQCNGGFETVEALNKTRIERIHAVHNNEIQKVKSLDSRIDSLKKVVSEKRYESLWSAAYPIKLLMDHYSTKNTGN